MIDLQHGNTPLHLAAKFGNLDVADLLLKFGAEANVQNLVGRHCVNGDFGLSI